MLIYRYDTHVMEIVESQNETDVEFKVRIFQESPYVENMKLVRHFFEENEVYTDVLFYVFPNQEYSVIVRKDYYTDFITELFKNKLIRSVEWAN